MAENLVVNGETYQNVEAVAMKNDAGEQVAYYPDAVRYNPQTLTDAQKAQARTNMGAASAEDLNQLSAKKVDKDQGAENAGKILGIGYDGMVAPVDAPSGGSGGGISDTAQNLLITILKAGAYKTDQSANIIAFQAALASGGSGGGSGGGVTVYAIINSLTNVTSDNSSASIVAQSSYSATLTPADGYAIESVTVTMGGEDVTETVWNAETGEITISSVTGDILITATAVESAASVTSWLYHFDGNLYAAGEKDFGLTLNPLNNYTTATYEDGKFGKAFDGYANNYGGGLYAQDLTEYPVLDGDFTIAFWAKNGRKLNNSYVLSTTSSNAWPYNKTNIPATLVDTDNWTIGENTGRSATEGLSICFNTANIAIAMVSADDTCGFAVNFTPTAGMDVDVWHHYALTRKGETIMFFFDGKMVCTWAYSGELYSVKRIFINCYLNTSAVIINSYNSIDELLIDDESCRYDADFTVPTAPYAG